MLFSGVHGLIGIAHQLVAVFAAIRKKVRPMLPEMCAR
jgi:hypothetical protein